MFRIEIATDNDAFAGDAAYEVSSLLEGIGVRIREEGLTRSEASGRITDSSGNEIGKWQYTNDD